MLIPTFSLSLFIAFALANVGTRYQWRHSPHSRISQSCGIDFADSFVGKDLKTPFKLSVNHPMTNDRAAGCAETLVNICDPLVNHLNIHFSMDFDHPLYDALDYHRSLGHGFCYILPDPTDVMRQTFKLNYPPELTGDGAYDFLSERLETFFRSDKAVDTIVDLSGFQINEQVMMVLTENLGRIKLLNLSNVEFDSGKTRVKHIYPLAQALKENDSLETLDLSRNYLGDKAIRLFTEMLAVNRRLKHFDISTNRFEKLDTWKTLAEALKENTSLKHLNVAKNLMRNEGAKILAGGLKENTALESLDVSGNDVHGNGSVALIKALSTRVHTLNLGKNRLATQNNSKAAPEILGSIAELLPLTKLKKLDLSDNGLGCKNMKILFPGIVQTKSLEELNLHHNSIKTCGVQVLSDNLQKYPSSLKRLDISLNEISQKSFKYLNRILDSETQLDSINLAMNPQLGDMPLSVFRKSLLKLKSLDLSRTDITDKKASKLSYALKTVCTGNIAPRIEQLDLSGNRIGEAAETLGYDFQHCVGMKSIDLSSNQVDAKTFLSLYKSVDHNNQVTSCTRDMTQRQGLKGTATQKLLAKSSCQQQVSRIEASDARKRWNWSRLSTILEFGDGKFMDFTLNPAINPDTIHGLEQVDDFPVFNDFEDSDDFEDADFYE